MKKYLLFVSILGLLSCSKDKAPDCIKSAGSLVVATYTIDSFDKILVNENIELTITQGAEYQLRIEAGEHLISDVNYTIDNGLLTLTDNNSCNWVRRYNPTKIFVITPTLREIRSNTQYVIKSSGTLTFAELNLISENFNLDNISSGDFDLQIHNQNLSIVSNNLSQFYLSGSTDTLFIGFYAGTTGFFGANLEANHINIFHRSSHDMVVHPKESLTGELRSTGDLISVYAPEDVNVQELYTGKLIFLD